MKYFSGRKQEELKADLRSMAEAELTELDRLKKRESQKDFQIKTVPKCLNTKTEREGV